MLKGSVQVLADNVRLQVFRFESCVKLTWLSCPNNPVSFCSDPTNISIHCITVTVSVLRVSDISQMYHYTVLVNVLNTARFLVLLL